MREKAATMPVFARSKGFVVVPAAVSDHRWVGQNVGFLGCAVSAVANDGG